MDNVDVDGRSVFVCAFDLGEFLKALMLGILEFAAFVEVLYMFGFDPGRCGDFAEGFNACVFFSKASQLLNEALGFIGVNSCGGNGFFGIPICFPEFAQKPKIVESKALEDERVGGRGFAIFVKLKGNNNLGTTDCDLAGSIINFLRKI